MAAGLEKASVGSGWVTESEGVEAAPPERLEGAVTVEFGASARLREKSRVLPDCVALALVDPGFGTPVEVANSRINES